MIHFFGTAPHSRLSALCPRLSPIIKKWPGGTVISLGRLHRGCEHGVFLLMNGSFWSFPSMYTRLFSTLRRSPGTATTRLMKLLLDFCGVACWHGWPSSGSVGTPHVLLSAPAGGLKTTMSPRWGSEK